MTIRSWLSASKGASENSKKNAEYSEETYIEIHNLLLQDSKEEDNSELNAGTNLVSTKNKLRDRFFSMNSRQVARQGILETNFTQESSVYREKTGAVTFF